MAQINNKTKKFLVKHLYFDFYECFSTNLKRCWLNLSYQDILYVESTQGWAAALHDTCLARPCYMWFWHIWDKAAWYDSDILDGFIGTRLYNYCKKGKIEW